MPAATSALDVASFSLSPILGFLPHRDPAPPLPSAYTPWEELNAALPTLIADKKLAAAIQSLPIIPTTELTTTPQYRRAYVLLAFLTHAYIHSGCGGGSNVPAETNPTATLTNRHTNGTPPSLPIVPPSLSDPFLHICTHLDMQPVLSYAGLCLWNWTWKSPPPAPPRSSSPSWPLTSHPDTFTLPTLSTLASFTGTPDEAAFYLIPVIAEAAAGHIPSTLLSTITSSTLGNWSAVSASLRACEATFREMIAITGQLNAHCAPDVFYGWLRPFIAGLEVAFAKSDGSRVDVKCVGGSVVQSALFMAIDRLLGVEHRAEIFKEMRAYMPRSHRAFLESLDGTPSLPDILDAQNAPPEIRESLRLCLQALQDWRGKHIAIVSRYIVLPARKAMAAAGGGVDSGPLLGTGGSSLVEFLKESRDETVVAASSAKRELN